MIEDCEDMPFTAMNPRVNRLYPVSSGVVNSVLATEKTGESLSPSFMFSGKPIVWSCAKVWYGTRLKAASSK